jgi:PIN domain nuclease of toxin-antitoxin system
LSGNLLDTNVALIATSDPTQLSRSVRDAILAGPNMLSVISYWEVVLKSMKGKLDVGDPQSWWVLTQQHMRAKVLNLRDEHVTALGALSAIHQDPFDRVLIAQAKVNDLSLLTTDSIIEKYICDRVRIVT